MSRREISLSILATPIAPDDFPLPPPPGAGLLEVHLTRRFQQHHLSADGGIGFSSDGGIPSQESWGEFLLPQTILALPLLLREFLLNVMRSFDLDRAACDYAVEGMEEVAVDMARAAGTGGFELVAYVEINTVEEINVDIVELISQTVADFVIKSLKKHTFRTQKTSEEQDGGGEEEELCPVCLEEFSDGAEYTELPCSHIFHHDCILEWMHGRHYSCPSCRSTMLD